MRQKKKEGEKWEGKWICDSSTPPPTNQSIVKENVFGIDCIIGVQIQTQPKEIPKKLRRNTTII